MVYAIDDRDEITSVNEAWSRFAAANGGEDLPPEKVLGRSLWDFIADPTTQHLYGEILHRVRDGTPVGIPLRCDAPDRRRYLDLTITSQPKGSVEFRSQVLIEEPREIPPWPSPQASPTGELLRVCGWCKRVDIEDVWVEIEEAVARLGVFARESVPELTHGICQQCYETAVSAANSP